MGRLTISISVAKIQQFVRKTKKNLYVSAESCIFAALTLIDMKGKLFEIAPLLPLAVCMMAGIVVGRYVSLPVSWWFFLLGGVAISLILRRYVHLQTVGIVICFVFLGAALMERQLLVERQSSTVDTQDSRLSRSKTFFLHQRDILLQRLSDGGLHGDAYAVVAAMVLGDKSALTKELKDTYSVTGASHVLALSGLHLSIIYMLLSMFVVGRRRRVITQLLVIMAIWAFVFLVGMSVSVVRAAIMLSVYALLSLGYRDKMSVNTLAFTAIVMLVFSPWSLFDIGFQMSFMAVLSILLWMPLFDHVFPTKWQMEHLVVKWLWGMMAVSLAAQLGVAPLIAYYFGRFSTYFLLTNVVVVPAATIILWFSPMVIIVPSLAYILLYMVNSLNSLLTWIAALPGASIEGLRPSLLQVVMIYVVIAAVWLLIRKTSPTAGWSA